MESDLFYAGVRPAINVGRSVSRVGGEAQVKAMKQVAGSLRLDLSQYRELEAFAQFGSDLDKATQAQLNRGERIVEALTQKQYVPMSVSDQVVALFAVTRGYLDDVKVEHVQRFERDLLRFVKKNKPEIMHKINEEQEMSDELTEELKAAIEEFKKSLSHRRGRRWHKQHAKLNGECKQYKTLSRLPKPWR